VLVSSRVFVVGEGSCSEELLAGDMERLQGFSARLGPVRQSTLPLVGFAPVMHTAAV
jgi:hypothetical protein